MSISRPAEPETVKHWLLAKAEQLADSLPLSPAQVGLLAGLLNGIFLPEEPTAEEREAANNARHGLLEYVFGIASLNGLTRGEVRALFAWLEVGNDEAGKYHVGSPYAVAEGRAMYRAFLEGKGQKRLPWMEEV